MKKEKDCRFSMITLDLENLSPGDFKVAIGGN